MNITVKKMNFRMSPRKVRPVLYGLRGSYAENALNKLAFTQKKVARELYQLLKSGVAAAKENDLDLKELYIKEIFCNEGQKLARRRFEAKGRVRKITHKMSHLVMTLSNEAVVNKSEGRNSKSETKLEKTVKEIQK